MAHFSFLVDAIALGDFSKSYPNSATPGWLYRDRGYVTDKPVASRVEMPSPDHMLIRTFYEGITTLGDETVAYEENFRWAGDRRLRSVLAWDKEHQLTLMGQYMEYKLAA
ncbi:MAG: phycobiliprotein lyase [Hydrococcus sp. CRU_1_1]|nr:phycobiliprotein lyase [Hydrococcus sp. CRU_1_1]NJQ96907.1 phycobiliprotein lyase [Hydrococcus sp. CSU_1_8]